MANLQYIGARYVPKFYLNPDYPAPDTRNNDWKSGVDYEALTIVTYNNDSYTSKQPVPDTVGSPIDNPDYWACTTKYTAALVALQTTVQNLEDFVNPAVPINTEAQTVTGAINELALRTGTIVTPEMYGAVGDGTTDDSAAISEAATHGLVYCGSNTYYIANNCFVSNSLFGGKFKINNAKSIVFTSNNCFAYGGEFFNDTLPDGTQTRGSWLVNIDGADNFHVESCVFHDAVSCVYINRADNVIVNGCVFENIVQNAPDIGGNGYGVLMIETNNTKISNNIFHNVARHSIYISHDETSTYNENVLISDNNFVWDSNVSGNTTGYECTIMIRPARHVKIVNNNFENMFSVCSINRQMIYVGGSQIWATTSDLLIKNNVGRFNHVVRTDAVVYVTGGSSTESLVVASDIVIDSNNFEMSRTALFKANGINGVTISNNRLKFVTSGNSIAVIIGGSETDMIDDWKNFYITKNEIIGESTNGTSLFYRVNAPNVGYTGTYGDFVVTDNVMKNITTLGTIPAGASFDLIKIADNIFDFLTSRAYFSDCVPAVLYLRNNSANLRYALHVAAASDKCLSTDLMFSSYGYVSTPPDDAVVGSMWYRSSDQVIMIKKPNSWDQLV